MLPALVLWSVIYNKEDMNTCMLDLKSKFSEKRKLMENDQQDDKSEIFHLLRLYPEKCPVLELQHTAVPGRVKYEDAVKCQFSTAKVGDKFGPR